MRKFYRFSSLVFVLFGVGSSTEAPAHRLEETHRFVSANVECNVPPLLEAHDARSTPGIGPWSQVATAARGAGTISSGLAQGMQTSTMVANADGLLISGSGFAFMQHVNYRDDKVALVGTRGKSYLEATFILSRPTRINLRASVGRSDPFFSSRGLFYHHYAYVTLGEVGWVPTKRHFIRRLFNVKTTDQNASDFGVITPVLESGIYRLVAEANVGTETLWGDSHLREGDAHFSLSLEILGIFIHIPVVH